MSHVVAHIQIPVFKKLNSILSVFLLHFFIHLSVNGYLGCFHLLGIVNSGAALNMGVQILIQDPTFNSLGHIFRSGSLGF